jgi:parallel beta-helix repeat protein
MPRLKHHLNRLKNFQSLKHSRFSKANLAIFAVIFASIGGYLIYSSFAATASCTGAPLNPGNISSAVSTATAGTVICLNDGSYSLSLSGVNKASDVTVQSVNGVGANLGYVDIGSSTHIKLDSVTINGGYFHGNKNSTIQNSKFTAYFRVDGTAAGNDNVLIDSNTFENINLGNGYEGRLSLAGGGGTAAQPVGITISNNHFGGGGNTDGIFITNGTYGAQIGPGNEFDNLVNVGGAHIDALQLYGSSHTTITGNYFHDNSSGIMACDGGNTETIKNNTFANTSYNAMCASHVPGLLIEHNTLYNNGDFRVDDSVNPQSSTTPTTAIIRNNIGSISIGGSGLPGPYYGSLTRANNLFVGAASPDLNGSPTFVGGANPSTQTGIAGFALASNSAGKNAATDGTDVGSAYFGTVGPQVAAVCSQTLAAGANISTAVSSAAAGSLICLGDGAYSGITLSGVNKTSMVTIKSVNGAASVDVGTLTWSGTSNIKLDGVTYRGGNITGASHDLQIVNSIGTTAILIINSSTANANILLDHNQHLNIPNPCNNNACVEGMVSVNGSANPSGVTIQNSFFSGGTADGIQVGARAVKILNNEFTNIVTSDPHHNDPIQLYGAAGTVISGNYLHGNDTGIMAPDGESNPTITNNVIVQTAYPWPIVIGGWVGGTITHNTFPTRAALCSFSISCGTLHIVNGTDGTPSSNLTIRDNIFGGRDVTGGSTAVENYNIFPTGQAGTGANDIAGTPTYSGGATPTTLAGFALTSTSIGKGNASDSTDRGANVATAGIQNGAPTPPPPLPPPPPPPPAPGCLQSSNSWQNSSFTAQTTNFTFDFDATPNTNNMNGITGLSSGAASAYANLAVIVRFNATGTIDAVNGSGAGGNYTADANVPYTSGTSYHFKLTINPSSHTYSVVVTPSGASAITLAANYPFRSEQATLSTLNNWAIFEDPGTAGSHSVCSVVLNQSAGPKQGDINGDNAVNITDLSLLLSSYGQTTTKCITNNAFTCDLSSPADNIVNIFDLSILLSHYGT